MRALFLLGLLLVGCSKPSPYKLIDVPYCQNPAGQARSGFNESVRFLYKAGDSSGEGPVSGTYPSVGIGSSDSLPRDEMLLAIVACGPLPPGHVPVLNNSAANAGQALTATNVPTVCPGQRTLFHGTVKGADDAAAKAKGYAGVLRFPQVALTCSSGTLQRTTSADIQAP